MSGQDATAAHTEAPWRAIDGVDIEGANEVIKERGQYFQIEFTPGITALSGYISANEASLIIAAPDMLTALRGLLAIVAESRGVDGYHLNGAIAEWDEFDEINAAHAAIAKATGAA